MVFSTPVLLCLGYYEKKGLIDKKDHLASRGSRFLSRYLVKLTGSTVKISGQENLPSEGAVLFVSNHQGHMDSLIIHGFIDRQKGFISIVEVLRYPIIRTWMKNIRCVFLDRKDPRQSSTCINQAIEHLKNGHSMVVFPEGRLSDGCKMDSFQRGWLRLATRSGVPIIPVSISNSYQAFAKDGSKVMPAKIECVISPAIHPGRLNKSEEARFIECVRTQIMKHVKTQTA